NRMENNNIDPKSVISEIAAFIEKGGYDAKILGASYKNVTQITDTYAAGAKSATVPLDLLTAALGMPSIPKAVGDFKADFEAVHGKGSTMKTV
ncbi:MAG: transaldolase family protein, partial [Oscillospiraceae bacterium]